MFNEPGTGLGTKATEIEKPGIMDGLKFYLYTVVVYLGLEKMALSVCSSF